jgi:hypothetical protein
MSSTAVSMELSVSCVSWINEQLRDQVEDRNTISSTRRHVNIVRSFVVAGVACISFALATIIAT